jgi:nitrogen regulatory protein PII
MSINLIKLPKVVIITEKLIEEQVFQILRENDATGYTVLNASGQGSRNIRSSTDSANLVDDFTNVQIEVILEDREHAVHVMEDVTAKLFKNFSGITFLEEIEVVRRAKFKKD